MNWLRDLYSTLKNKLQRHHAPLPKETAAIKSTSKKSAQNERLSRSARLMSWARSFNARNGYITPEKSVDSIYREAHRHHVRRPLPF